MTVLIAISGVIFALSATLAVIRVVLGPTVLDRMIAADVLLTIVLLVVGAEMVVAIELASFRLYNGPTMYKGRANMATTVYDLSLTGEPVFTQIPGEHVFPANVAYATTDMSENKFRRQFMISLAHRIAKNFYAYDKKDDFAADPTVVVP